FGAGEFYELHFLKLVLADHAANVFSIAAGLGAETGSVGAVGDRELGFLDGLVAEKIGDGDLGCGDEPMVAILKDAGLVWAFVVAVEEVFGELGKLASAEEGLRVDHVGRQDLG